MIKYIIVLLIILNTLKAEIFINAKYLYETEVVGDTYTELINNKSSGTGYEANIGYKSIGRKNSTIYIGKSLKDFKNSEESYHIGLTYGAMQGRNEFNYGTKIGKGEQPVKDKSFNFKNNDYIYSSNNELWFYAITYEYNYYFTKNFFAGIDIFYQYNNYKVHYKDINEVKENKEFSQQNINSSISINLMF